MKNLLINKENVLEFRSGCVAHVKHNSVTIPVLSVIQKVEEYSIYFKIPNEFSKKSIKLGDRIELKIFDNKHEYFIEAAIFEINHNYPSFIHAHVDKIQKYRARIPRRYIVSIPAFVRIPEYNKELETKITNISLNGIKILLDDYIDKRLVVDIKIKNLLNITKNIEFSVKLLKVSSMEDYNEYNTEITKIDTENKDILEKLIYKLEEDEKSLIAEYLK